LTAKANKLGKGIILMHDFQKHTAEAPPTLRQRPLTHRIAVSPIASHRDTKALQYVSR
jgi:hypothetical protein